MSTVANAPAVTGEAVVAAVTELAPRFAGRRAETALDRKIPVASMDELRDAGMLRMLVPAMHGGLEATIHQFVDATAAAARGCPSTGWCAGQMAFAALVFAAAPVEVQQVIWARSPDVRSASTAQGLTARPVPGGYVVAGKGPFASGINHAEWLYLGAPIIADGTMLDIRNFLIPKEQVSVLDTWQTTAMRGTGSNTVVVEDVFVPEEFTLRHAELREGTSPGSTVNSSSLYRLPWVTVVPLIYLATMLGATQTAYQAMVESVVDKRTPGGQRLAASEELQLELSFAAAGIDAARSQLYALADRADSGRPYTVKERAVATRDASFTTAQLVQAMDAVLAISGTGGFADTGIVQQCWSDVNFAAMHQALNKRLAGARFGRLELGIEDAVLPVFY